jgi:hypothetical protein
MPCLFSNGEIPGDLPFASAPYGPLPFPLSGVLTPCLPLPSVQFQFASCRSFPKRAIATGPPHLLGKPLHHSLLLFCAFRFPSSLRHCPLFLPLPRVRPRFVSGRGSFRRNGIEIVLRQERHAVPKLLHRR